MQKKNRNWVWLPLVAAALMAAGCASKAPQGYGVTQSTASLAQAQLMEAEQATEVNTASTYLGLIEKMQQAGHWYAALAHTEAFEKQYGISPEVQLLRADALRNTQQYELAQKIYLHLLATPQASRAYRGMGLLEANQGRYDAAISSLEKARKLNPIDANILSDMGYAYMRNGQLSQAQLPVMQAAQLAPSSPRVQLNLALFWMASGEEALGVQVVQSLRQSGAKAGSAAMHQGVLDSLQEQLSIVKKAIAARSAQELSQAGEAFAGPAVKVSSVGVVEKSPNRITTAETRVSP